VITAGRPAPVFAQSYQNASRETFWYDWDQKPYKASYIWRPLDKWDRAEIWYFGRLDGAASRGGAFG